jgi:hypothetical protein
MLVCFFKVEGGDGLGKIVIDIYKSTGCFLAKKFKEEVFPWIRE